MELSQVVPCAGCTRIPFVSNKTIFSVFLVGGLLCLLLHPLSLSAQQFQTAISTVTDVKPSVAAGDFNHDGLVDVATAGLVQGEEAMSVLLSNSDGTFTRSQYIDSFFANAIATADLNGDGNLDLSER